MQGVILAAGEGTRLRPITHHHPKPLIPFWGRPFIEYLLDAFEGVVDETIIVVGQDDSVRRHLGPQFKGMPLHYVCQPEPLGTGDAVSHAGDLIEGPFVLNLGDTLLPPATLRDLASDQLEAGLAVIEVCDPENHSGVACAEDWTVRKMWADGCSTVDAGCFRLPADALDLLANLPKRRGELRISQVLHALVQRGRDVKAIPTPQPWLQYGDHEGRSGVLRVMRQMRDRIQGAEPSGCSCVQVAIRGCEIRNSLIFGPGSLTNCEVRDSVVYCGREITGETIDRAMIALD